MIERATAAALERIAARQRDAAHAYEPGFVPENSEIVPPPARRVPSADPLSVAAPGGAYFTSAGSAGHLRFTRDGSFAVNAGMLCDREGRPVLGFALGNRSRLAPLRIDPYDDALGRISDPRVAADGTFSYAHVAIDPRTGERRAERIAVGRLALARFPAGTQPLRVDATHVAPPDGIAAHFGVPAEGSFAPLATNSRDLGGVALLTGLEKMRDACVAFDALRAAEHARGAFERASMDLVK